MQIYMASTGYDPIKESYPVDNNATASAVICADYVIPSFNQKASWLKFVKQIESQYSSVGTIAILWLSPMCVYWPVTSNPTLPEQPVKKFDSTFPQVLIIGNSEDPMTPFHNALAVKAYLKMFGINADIVKWNAVSHTALITDSPLSRCVFDNVDQFLLGKSLSDNLECSDWQNSFTMPRERH